jgi:hypothetical protein
MEDTNPSIAQYHGTAVDLAVSTRDDEVSLSASVLLLSALVLALADRLGCANNGWTGCNCCYDAEDHVSGGDKGNRSDRLRLGNQKRLEV